MLKLIILTVVMSSSCFATLDLNWTQNRLIELEIGLNNEISYYEEFGDIYNAYKTPFKNSLIIKNNIELKYEALNFCYSASGFNCALDRIEQFEEEKDFEIFRLIKLQNAYPFLAHKDVDALKSEKGFKKALTRAINDHLKQLITEHKKLRALQDRIFALKRINIDALITARKRNAHKKRKNGLFKNYQSTFASLYFYLLNRGYEESELISLETGLRAAYNHEKNVEKTKDLMLTALFIAGGPTIYAFRAAIMFRYNAIAWRIKRIKTFGEPYTNKAGAIVHPAYKQKVPWKEWKEATKKLTNTLKRNWDRDRYWP